MPETIDDVVADLKQWRGVERPIFGSLKETGLSHQAEMVIEKLSAARKSEGWHRVYSKSGGQMMLEDALTDRDIEIRGYQPAESDPIEFHGDSPATRDIAQLHKSPNPLYRDVWIGGTLV
jgi:hypothetical protein